MRMNEFGERMVLTAIQFFPIDPLKPQEDWSVNFSWAYVHEKSGQLYGDKQEPIRVSEAVAKGLMEIEDFTTIYSIIAPLADKMGTM